MKNVFVVAVAFALLLGVVAPTPLAAQQTTNPQQPASAQTGTPAPDQAMKSFSGKIVKEGDLFVLKDAVSGASYQLDDQKQARKFEGKDVRVNGSLDTASNTIHVQSIEEGSPSR